MLTLQPKHEVRTFRLESVLKWFAKIIIIINTVTSKEVVGITLKKILTMLPAQKFAQVHRCYIVNLSRITAYTKTELTIADTLIPVGRSFKQNPDKLLPS